MYMRHRCIRRLPTASRRYLSSSPSRCMRHFVFWSVGCCVAFRFSCSPFPHPAVESHQRSSSMNILDVPEHSALTHDQAMNLVGLARATVRPNPNAPPIPRPPLWAPPIRPAHRVAPGPRAGLLPAYIADSSTLMTHERKFLSDIPHRSQRRCCGYEETEVAPCAQHASSRGKFVGEGGAGGTVPARSMRPVSSPARRREPGAASPSGGVASLALSNEEASFIYRYAAYRTVKRLRRAMGRPVEVRQQPMIPRPEPESAQVPPLQGVTRVKSSSSASSRVSTASGAPRHCTRCARALCRGCGHRAHSSVGSASAVSSVLSKTSSTTA